MKIREIINSGQAPSSPQDLWSDRGSLTYFGSGWKAINASGTPPPADDEDSEEKVDSLDKEMGEVKQSIYRTILQSLSISLYW